MRLSLSALVLALFAWVAPDQTVGQLLASLRDALKAGRSDAEIARTLHDTNLNQKLDDAVIEELQSEGAGPQTLEELDRQRRLSATLAAPTEPLNLFDAPATPAPEEQSATIEKARVIALKYTEGLPNFLCTEMVQRYVDSKGSQTWKKEDLLKIDVGYSDKGERHRLLEINGRPATQTLAQVGGFDSSGEFGTLLKWIFAPESTTEFHWQRWSRLRGNLAYVFSYRVPQEHSQYGINWRTSSKPLHMVAAFAGLVYIVRATGQVTRYTHQAEGIPADWPIVATPAVADYDFADVGGKRFLLPKRLDSRIVLKRGQNRNVVEFGNYRKFEGEAILTFDK